MIVFIKQTAVFVTGRSFLVTFPMDLFTTKLCVLWWELCVSGELCLWQAKMWRNWGKKHSWLILAKKTNGRCGGLDLFCQRVMDAVSRGQDFGFANQSFSPSAPLDL